MAKKALLMILDGWGVGNHGNGDVIFNTPTPYMDYLAEIYLNYQTIAIEQLIGAKGKNQGNMRDLSPEAIYKYACDYADITLKLFHILKKELEDLDKIFPVEN